ncbi:MAG: ArnT family glycosyltransferase [Actinomycetota bacterium]
MAGSVDSSMASAPPRVVVADLERRGDFPRSESRLRTVVARIVALAREHPVLTVVVAVYALSCVVVPVRTNVSVSDDWVYIRQAHDLAFHGDLHVPDQAAANAVFDIVWGAAFARVLGSAFWVLRLSSIVLTLAGGFAFYWLCRRLGADRTLSGLATGLFLFNPLVYVLTFTFMTDAHFMALLVIATACYARGLGDDALAARWTWVGSAVAGLAYLSRQQGLLIPAAVVGFLVVSRRVRADRAGVRGLVRAAGVPALVVVGHRVWLELANGVPGAQEDFLDVVRDSGVRETALLVERLTYIEIMYIGLFTLPLVAGLALGVRHVVRRMPPGGWLAFCAWLSIVVAGLALFTQDLRRMPYLQNWFTASGLGAHDLIGGRPPFMTLGMANRLTQVTAVAAVGAGFVVIRAMADRATTRRAEAGLVGALLLAMVLGILAPSFQYRTVSSSPSLDRYLLPIIPLALALVVWAAQGIRWSRVLVGVGVAAAVVFSVVGTRDFLVFHRELWSVARGLNAQGVSNAELDAGAGWDRYYRAGRTTGVERDPDLHIPWWVVDIGPIYLTDSTYVIATTPLDGYEVVRRVPYSSILQTRDADLLVLRREREDDRP